MSSREEIIDRVRKCLAMGDSSRNPFEHEVETAIRMAKALMAQHNLSMADVAEKEGALAEAIREQEMAERSGAPSWEYDLVLVCKHLFGVDAFIRIGRPTYKKAAVFVGYETDVALAAEVYKLLKLELASLGVRWQRENPAYILTPKQALYRRFKYLDGVVLTLIRRAKEQSQMAAADASKVNALVVRKDDAISKWMAKYQMRQATRRSTGIHGDAFMAGVSDGKGMNMDFRRAMKGSDVPDSKRLGYDK